MALFPVPVDTYHTSTYDTIDPTKSELSQHGKNVVITGAGSGIGQAMALSFAKANVANLALLGRRLEALNETQELIKASNPETKVHIFSADISDPSSLETAFKSFATAIDGPIHTLVANAGYHPGVGSLTEFSSDNFASALQINGMGTLNTIRAFMPHAPTTTDATGYRAQIIHTSTGAVQFDMPSNNAYAVSKVAATKFVQAFALENPDIWVVNFHPGMINSPMSRGAGFVFESPDDPALPGDWTVWAASKASAFVPSGRFLWAHWDVEEVENLFAKMKSGELSDGDTAFGSVPIGQRFTIGLAGVPSL